jgi:alanine racemase
MVRKLGIEKKTDLLAKLRSKACNPAEPGPIERVKAVLSPQALKHNFKRLREMSGELWVIPMIKANAYGHGARWAARVLENEKGLLGFGVATREEAMEVRSALSRARGYRIPIYCFSGMIPWAESYGQWCEKHHVVPVIASLEDLRVFIKQGWAEKIPYELEFNTGMNRLGIEVSQLREVKRLIRSTSHRGKPTGIFTHLAAGEESEFKLTKFQIDAYDFVRSELTSDCPKTYFHFAASTAIFNEKHYQIAKRSDVIRPGISLYGVRPWRSAPNRDLRSVLSFYGKVVQVRALKPGDQVGYGGTFKVGARTVPLPYTVATVSMGYGDGLHRRLSNRGFVIISGKTFPIVGRVSMDLVTVACPKTTKPGDWVEFFGNEGDIWDQADKAETIPYELLTGITSRVPRIEETG